jgi:hypothetical protein
MSTYSPSHTQPLPTPPTQGATPGGSNQWGGGRVLALIFGCLLLLASLTLAAGGAAVAIANSTQRDAGGYLMSDRVALEAGGYAITSANLEIQGAARLPHRILGTAKVTVTPNGDIPVFVGVAKTSDVQSYLGGVRRTQVTVFAEDPVYQQLTGGAPAMAPTRSDIWIAQAAGSRAQTLTWPVENGNWTIVVMNADGSRGVSADVTTGATVPGIEWIYGGLFVGAGVTLLIGLVILAATVRRTRSAA